MADSQNCGLNIFQWNCNGLFAHLNEFKQHLARNPYDVICLQETFLKFGKNFTLPGFAVIRKDRENSRKGGLVTLIKDSLNFTEINIQSAIECISVKIKTDTSYITVVNVYISPDQTLDVVELSKLFAIIVGDLNSKNRLWGSP